MLSWHAVAVTGRKKKACRKKALRRSPSLTLRWRCVRVMWLANGSCRSCFTSRFSLCADADPQEGPPCHLHAPVPGRRDGGQEELQQQAPRELSFARLRPGFFLTVFHRSTLTAPTSGCGTRCDRWMRAATSRRSLIGSTFTGS